MAADIYARIRQAAFELVSEGVWPTVADVRAKLGSGSNTTINNTLKEWRQEFLSRISISSRRPDWPPSLAEAFEQIWQKACDEAEQQLDAVRREVEAAEAALRIERDELLQGLNRMETEAQSLRHELELRAAKQTELDEALRQERFHSEKLQTERQELLTAQESLRQELAQGRKQAEARQAELEEKHEQQLREAREMSERKESLAYERLEGLRVRLYQQVEDERTDMKQQLQKQEAALQQARQDAAKVEGLWRERVLERERENGGLNARLELARQAIDELREELRALRATGEAAGRLALSQAADLATQQERTRLLREQWLERTCAALASGTLPTRQDEWRSWLAAQWPEANQ
ncbi:DNA-binding protein [Chromobacterium alticapitis]|nr:DNA-binding protein [Chromobacterium alticapitis]